MLEYLLNLVNSIPEGWAFGAVIGVLLICGLGLPFPEEIPLFLAGYLVYSGQVHLNTCMLFTVMAILIGDSALFSIGHKFGPQIFQIPLFGKLLTPSRVKRVNEYFQKYGNGVVFVARFMAGVRGPVFLTAGILRMPYRRFILLDGIAALISAPTVVWATYKFCQYFSGETESVMRFVRKTEGYLLVLAVVLVALVWFVLYRVKRNRTLASSTEKADDSILEK